MTFRKESKPNPPPIPEEWPYTDPEPPKRSFKEVATRVDREVLKEKLKRDALAEAQGKRKREAQASLEIDLAISAIGEKSARNERLWARVSFFFVLVAAAALICGMLFIMVRVDALDREAREECVRSGGRVELVHQSRDAAWVCIGR
jgi:hypothetical protein